MPKKEEVLEIRGSAPGTTASVSQKKRTISGKIMVFDEIGATSGGFLKFAPGSIIAPAELKKIKLLMSHDQSKPVGYMTAMNESNGEITATFEVPKTADGDHALEQAKAGLYDGFSIGAHIFKFDPNYTGATAQRVINAELFEVSLVSTPAFQNARISSITAQKGLPMTEQNTQPETPKTEEKPEAPAPQQITAATNTTAPPAPAPVQTMSITAAADTIIKGVRSGDPAAIITAALKDVVPANDKGEAFLRKTWVGELWKASEVSRPIIESFGAPKKLTGLKAYGWRWKDGKTPVVGKYNSDKTAIPSNELATEPAEGVTQDFAAGWDVARKYIDLGDTGFIESIFQMATDDYRRKTEEWFSEQIINEAQETAEVTSVLGALQKFPILFGKIGARLNVIQMGEAAYESFLNLPEDSVPWWLKGQGQVDLSKTRGVAASVSYMLNTALEDNAMLAYDPRAASYYEHGSSPIRAQVLDLPRGGVDVGVFGYAGALVHDPRCIMKATVAAAGA